jgi:pimeloyl-ACP methyl ester carboxylesterase
VTKRFEPNVPAETAGVEFGREILRGLTGDVGAWLAWETAERDPRRGLEWLLERTSTLTAEQRAAAAQTIAASHEQRDWYTSLIGTFNPLSPRETGARNDLVQNRALEKFPFATIAVPTLFIHGEQDRCVLLADSQAAAAAMPGAELMAVPGAGHIVQLGGQGADVQKKLTEFFRRHTGGFGHP